MKNILIFIILLYSDYGVTQNTIGVLLHDQEKVFEGYNLFMANKQSTAYLINNCGEIINSWSDHDFARIGAELYLMPDGKLLKAKVDKDVNSTSSIGAGGAGGVLEIVSWENELLWQYVLQDSLQRQHHDICIMPNGHILAIVWDRYFLDDILEKGFDTLSYNQREIWPDKIIEIDPQSSEVVWEWKGWDHVIQDFDSTKVNYTNIHDHPESININYQDFTFSKKDWMHSNAIDYNANLDQIILSVRNFNEIWIIDHSTTTNEAATNKGGNSDKGGGILWRWGNNHAYKMGNSNDRVLHYQHDAGWVQSPKLINSPYFNTISVYNNFIDSRYSMGTFINPQLANDGYNYLKNENDTYLPNTIFADVSHPDTLKQYSSAGSNIQLLPNGNILMHAARQGRTIELTNDEVPVWEYLVPLKQGEFMSQGDDIFLSENFTFSLRRYPVDFSGFDDKDMSAKGFLELNPNESFCILSTISDNSYENNIVLYPNPVNNTLNISCEDNFEGYIYDFMGKSIMEISVNKQESYIDISSLSNGLYFLKSNNRKLLKFIIHR
ncbi:MAG: aryl-sulfate sulfotransferase [Saprospiraceae bacterium]